MGILGGHFRGGMVREMQAFREGMTIRCLKPVNFCLRKCTDNVPELGPEVGFWPGAGDWKPGFEAGDSKLGIGAYRC
jgi:hypothetical protein